MKQTDKKKNKKSLKITYIFNENDCSIEDIMKEICVCYLEKKKLR